jgi:molecular chaperone DnaK
VWSPAGARTTPSVVAFTDQGERLVGKLARRQAILNPKGTIYSAKRFTGRHFDEVASEITAVSFDVVAGPDGAVRFKVRDTLYVREEVPALVLRKLVEDASKFLGEKVTGSPRGAYWLGVRSLNWAPAGSATVARRP